MFLLLSPPSFLVCIFVAIAMCSFECGQWQIGEIENRASASRKFFCVLYWQNQKDVSRNCEKEIHKVISDLQVVSVVFLIRCPVVSKRKEEKRRKETERKKKNRHYSPFKNFISRYKYMYIFKIEI
jgi:hypothetical protein